MIRVSKRDWLAARRNTGDEDFLIYAGPTTETRQLALHFSTDRLLTEISPLHAPLAVVHIGGTEVSTNGRARRGPKGQEPETVMPVGKVVQCVQGSDWGNYMEQLEFFFLENGIRNAERKKAVLMANVPAEFFK